MGKMKWYKMDLQQACEEAVESNLPYEQQFKLVKNALIQQGWPAIDKTISQYLEYVNQGNDNNSYDGEYNDK